MLRLKHHITYPPILAIVFLVLGIFLHFLIYDFFLPELDIFVYVAFALLVVVTILVLMSIGEHRHLFNKRVKRPSGHRFKRGFYKYSRHPIYVSLLLLFVAISLLLNSGVLLIFAFFDFAYLNFFVIPREEKQMKRIFREEYVEYRDSVPRWF